MSKHTPVTKLDRSHEEAIIETLLIDPTQNLFLLGFIDTHGLDHCWWYGVVAGEHVRSLVMVIPGRLAVPWVTQAEDAHALGAFLASRHPPSMIVGPRTACDAIWSSWGAGVTPDRFYDQRLYSCRERPGGPREPGFRRARPGEWQEVAVNCGQMEEEDLGRNPYRDDPRTHERVIRDRLAEGRTWVLEDAGHIVFQINVGTMTPFGCQVGGTYVPPALRGRGYAGRGVRALCNTLLPLHRQVTLHVNEANQPAVRCYERCGFERLDAFRLVTLP